MKSRNIFKNSANSLSNLRQNFQHNFAFNHSIMLFNKNAIYSMIPKNACSTLRLSIALDNGCIESVEQGHWIHNNNDTFKPSLSEAIRANYTFVILRCPFRRLASVFLDKFVAKEPEAWNYRSSLGRTIELDDLTFSNFVLSLKSGAILNQNPHWRKQVDFLLYKSYSDYFCLEDFNTIQDTLRTKIEFEIEDARPLTEHGLDKYRGLNDHCYADVPSFEIALHKKRGECPSYKSMFNEELIKIVENLYQEDFQLYRNKFGGARLLFDNN